MRLSVAVIKGGAMRASLPVVSGIIVLFASAPVVLADPPGTKLTADQIRQQLVDHTTYGTVNGAPFVQYVSPAGTQKIKVGNFNDAGNWRIMDNGQLCRTWKVSTGGREECVTVYKNGDTYYSVTPEGAVRASYTAKPGNPEQL
jgi:hypothetical protein